MTARRWMARAAGTGGIVGATGSAATAAVAHPWAPSAARPTGIVMKAPGA